MKSQAPQQAIAPRQYDENMMIRSPAISVSKGEGTIHQENAGKLDSILTACHTDRYVLDLADRKLQYIYGLTKHSPYQVLYGQLRAVGGNSGSTHEPNQYLKEKGDRDLSETTIIVASSGALSPDIENQLHEFSERPTCGESFLPLHGLRVFFRQ